ncbi:MAG: hypothetical protein AB7I19_07005 [Planctomycetota bacterium]
MSATLPFSLLVGGLALACGAAVGGELRAQDGHPMEIVPGVTRSPESDASRRLGVHSMVLGPNGVDLARLGLGDGGMGSGRNEPAPPQAGHYRSAGGALVRVQGEGLKVDLPSGGDLIVDPDGVIVLRDGSHTVGHRGGVLLLLADGTTIEITPHGGRGEPFRVVEIEDRSGRHTLWRRGQPPALALAARRARMATFAVLGDGRTLYRLGQVGPLLAFELALCPKANAGEVPREALVVLGDLLVTTLMELGQRVRQQFASEPQFVQKIIELADAGPLIFGREEPYLRPAKASGDLWIELRGDFRLAVELRDGGNIALDLWVAGRDTPEAEWILGSTSYLHTFRRERDGRLRYAMAGLNLRTACAGALPFETGSRGIGLARRLLANQTSPRTSVPIEAAAGR